jgi:hypothetical protein
MSTALYITPRAVEEAGHAVMAAHLNLPVSKIQINSNTAPGSVGGSVEQIFHLDRVNPEYVRKHALISMAGEAARRFLWQEAEVSTSDRDNVRWLYGLLNERPPFKSLRVETDKIFRDEHLRRTVRLVAFILECDRTISAREVKRMVKISAWLREQDRKTA